MTGQRRSDAIALGILTAVVALLFLDVLAGAGSLYSRDLGFYYYPAKHVLREIVLGGEFPHWNPWFSAGQPMAANPEHEVFYPLTWLILLPGFDLGFRLLVVLHVWIAAWTMYALLRSMRLGAAAAFLGALGYALGGIIGSTLALLPYLFILAWLPLTCLYARRALLFRKRRDLALTAFFLGLQVIIGEPTTVFQSGLLIGLYAAWRGARKGGWRGSARSIAIVGAISIAALLLSAVQTLPAIDHAADSVRARGFPFSIVGRFSMPLAKTGEWLYPNLLGALGKGGERLYWGASLYPDAGYPYLKNIYPGLLVGALAIAGLFARIRGAGFVLGTVAISIVLAMGANTPLLGILYEASLVRALRYPEKFILFGTFTLTVFSACVVSRLLRGDARIRKAALAATAAVAVVAAVAAALTFAPRSTDLFRRVWTVDGAAATADVLTAWRSGWLLAAAKGGGLLALLASLGRVRRSVSVALMAAFALLDLSSLVPDLAPRIDPAFYREPPPLLRQLPRELGTFRVFGKATWDGTPAAYQRWFRDPRERAWVTRNALYPVSPALFGVRTVLEPDYDLTALRPTEDFTESMFELGRLRDDWAAVAASMSNAWFGTGWDRPEAAYARAGGHARVLQPLRLITLPRHPRYYFAQHVESIRDRREFVVKLGSGRFPPRTAFVTGQAFPAQRGDVLAVRESANHARIDVTTEGRAFLVMSVTPHKYWRVTVDGAEARAVVTNAGYQGVEIPAAGRHVVEMRYRNPLITAGAAVSLCMLLVIFLAARTMRAL